MRHTEQLPYKSTLRKVAETVSAPSRSQSAYGVNLKWNSASTLQIQFLTAQDARLEAPVLRMGGRVVHVVLKPGIVDETAPSGGMLYNLEH